MNRIICAMTIVLLAVSASFAQTTRPVATPPVQQNGFQQRQFNNQYNNQYNGDQRGFRRQRRGGYENPQGGMFAATTQPDVTPTPPPMTGDWLIFTNRDIFVKGRFAGYNPPTGDEGPRQPTPADTLVFCGVFEATPVPPYKSYLTAFLQDNDTLEVTPVRVGDQIAQGKVTGITLDTLEYQTAGGRLLHLNVGQNLNGEQVWGGVTSNSPSSVPEFSGPNADLLKKMAERRLQELSGTPAASK
jgi:hypothetical protein